MSTIRNWIVLICNVHLYGVVIAADPRPPKRGTLNANSEFEDSIRCSTFADKTLLIDDFFQSADSSPYQLVTCPRMFGKSTNIKMMKSFCEVSVDEEGDRIRRKVDTVAYFIFTDDRVNLNIGPLIQNHGFLFRVHFKGYPMIYANFRNVIGHTYEEIIEGLRWSIKTMFESYEWMHRILAARYPPGKHDETHPVMRSQVKFLKKMLDGNIDENDVVNSLYEISKILFEYFGRDTLCFLIIDDYDAPIQNAIENNLNVTRVTRLIEKMLSKVLHPDNTYVRYALLSGISNVLKSKVSNVKHRAFLENHVFTEYFGFTETEVDKLFLHHSLDTFEKNALKRHYGGYLVDGTTRRMYNPLSIVKYLSAKTTHTMNVQIENFWAESGIRPNFLQLFKYTKIGNAMAEFLLSKTVSYLIRKNWNYQDLEELRRLKHGEIHDPTDYHVRLFFAYLLENGYLGATMTTGVFTFPNREIETNIIDTFNAFYMDVCGINLQPLQKALIPLLESENGTTKEAVTKCENALRKIFYETKNPSFQFGGNEYQYQALIYCSAKEVVAHEDDIVIVNIDELEQIKRRAYIVLERSQSALVFELNYGENATYDDDATDYQTKVDAVYKKYQAIKQELASLEPPATNNKEK